MDNLLKDKNGELLNVDFDKLAVGPLSCRGQTRDC